jgi:hypothetical protein
VLVVLLVLPVLIMRLRSALRVRAVQLESILLVALHHVRFVTLEPMLVWVLQSVYLVQLERILPVMRLVVLNVILDFTVKSGPLLAPIALQVNSLPLQVLVHVLLVREVLSLL